MSLFKRTARPAATEFEHTFPAELLAEAATQPGGWVYEIDPAFAPDDDQGSVPPEGIKGAWRIGLDGIPTGEYERNNRYRG